MSKKAAAAAANSGPQERPLLGRVSSHLKMGCVGLPNVGKSSLFNLLTKMQVPAENYPFCTVEPTVARCAIPDEKWEWLCQLYKPRSRVQAYLEVVDIAGLVRGAANGQGLGNAFLSHIAAVDGIYHVTRVFENEEVTHVDNDIDPIRDLETIRDELLLKDIEIVKRRIEPLSRVARSDKSKKFELDVLTKVLDAMEKEKKEVRMVDWNAKEVEVLNTLQLLTAKPAVYLVNMSESDYLRQKNKWLPKIKAWVEARAKEPIIPFSVAFEQKLVNMSPEEAEAYCKANNTKSMLPRIIKAGFSALHLMNYYTCGEDEVKAWTIHKGTKAPQAAAVIHSDFEKYFIAAEVMKFDDLKEYGSEAGVRAHGKLKTQGKEYVVEEGDIILFKHNAKR